MLGDGGEKGSIGGGEEPRENFRDNTGNVVGWPGGTGSYNEGEKYKEV